jgi:maltooligosyltrehalose trehalohydrolase
MGAARASFVTFLQNHDQVANSAWGRRGTLTSPGRWRAMTALLLLGPGTPLLFQVRVRGVGAVSLFCGLRRAAQRGGP